MAAAALSWDTDLARAALRIARGESMSKVQAEYKQQTGKTFSRYISYGFFPSENYVTYLSSKDKIAAVAIVDPSFCVLHTW